MLSGNFDGTDLVPQPLDVFALGAGPNAVGSAAVVISRFEAATVARHANYTLTYNERRTFDKLQADLVERIPGQDSIERKMIAEQNVCVDTAGNNLCINGPPRSPYQTSGQWPTQGERELATGSLYHMELRAWSTRSPSGGWLIDQAPQTVTWR